jgi:hypothetical protein
MLNPNVLRTASRPSRDISLANVSRTQPTGVIQGGRLGIAPIGVPLAGLESGVGFIGDSSELGRYPGDGGDDDGTHHRPCDEVMLSFTSSVQLITDALKAKESVTSLRDRIKAAHDLACDIFRTRIDCPKLPDTVMGFIQMICNTPIPGKTEFEKWRELAQLMQQAVDFKVWIEAEGEQEQPPTSTK